MLTEVIYPGVFGIEHILYLCCFIGLLIGEIFLIRKLKKNQQTILIRILAGLHLCFILINRISVTYSDVVIQAREGYTWLNLIPNMYCGWMSLVLPIVVFVGKKDNVMLHFIAYLAFFGGVITMIYPDFLDSQSFWDIRSITGLLHHSLMVYGVVALVMCGWMRPTLKRWYVYPLGYACLMTVGLFEETALGFTKSIYAPLIGSMEILTSWYMMYGVTTLLAVLTMYIFDKKSLCKSNC